jgi:5-methylcytosine-specific restriction enzyme subunit McrC
MSINGKPAIIKFEHDKLLIGEGGFEQRHLTKLLQLNDRNGSIYFEGINKGVKFKQYVGVIQVDDLLIEILPKTDKVTSSDNWRSLLLNMLKTCKKLKATTYGSAFVKKRNINLLEIYFSLYIAELNQLIRQGLIKKYKFEESNQNALRGKLLFHKNIQYNLVHKQRFFTQHQVYDINHDLHQFLFSALLVVEKLSFGKSLFENCKLTKIFFNGITPSKHISRTIDSFELNRKTKPYENAFELARLILLNYSPDISSGKEKMLALLFDMNKLWEEYVFIKLRNQFSGSPYALFCQNQKNFWANNRLRPDIVVYNNNSKKVEIIIDTKWKIVNNTDISVQDLRQMYTYSKFWNTPNTVILYPGNYRNNNFINFDNQYDKPSLSKCKTCFVSVIDSNGNLNENLAIDIIKQLEIEIT